MEENQTKTIVGKQEQIEKREIKDDGGRTRHHDSSSKKIELVKIGTDKEKDKEGLDNILEQSKSAGFGGLLHICNWKKLNILC
ncbi:hypothetical protein LIER_20227 [Lithospermum erythrorhizon]|uniref:Uncharacterized protein n=1 Tax=Lithospermum erythrorhizon TaxID=34254 RepID=A0AAV3QKR4_LITER